MCGTRCSEVRDDLTIRSKVYAHQDWDLAIAHWDWPHQVVILPIISCKARANPSFGCSSRSGSTFDLTTLINGINATPPGRWAMWCAMWCARLQGRPQEQEVCKAGRKGSSLFSKNRRRFLVVLFAIHLRSLTPSRTDCAVLC